MQARVTGGAAPTLGLSGGQVPAPGSRSRVVAGGAAAAAAEQQPQSVPPAAWCWSQQQSSGACKTRCGSFAYHWLPLSLGWCCTGCGWAGTGLVLRARAGRALQHCGRRGGGFAPFLTLPPCSRSVSDPDTNTALIRLPITFGPARLAGMRPGSHGPTAPSRPAVVWVPFSLQSFYFISF